MTSARALKVLLVDDSEADRVLTRCCLEDSKVLVDLHDVDGGDVAMEYLRGASDGDLPDLILLDLNMPGIDGREVLRLLREDERLAQIPVVVLTSSAAEKDIVETYQLGANCYVSKPVDLSQFEVIVESVANFWFMVVKLPRKS